MTVPTDFEAEPVEESLASLHGASWTVGARGEFNSDGESFRIVSGRNGENLIRSEGLTAPWNGGAVIVIGNDESPIHIAQGRTNKPMAQGTLDARKLPLD